MSDLFALASVLSRVDTLSVIVEGQNKRIAKLEEHLNRLMSVTESTLELLEKRNAR